MLVCVVSRSQEWVDATVTELGTNAAAQHADVRDLAAVEQAKETCAERAGLMDIVVSEAIMC